MGIPPLCDISVSGSSALFGSNHQLVVWEQPSICVFESNHQFVCLFDLFIVSLGHIKINQHFTIFWVGKE